MPLMDLPDLKNTSGSSSGLNGFWEVLKKFEYEMSCPEIGLQKKL
jgi:hypothetical protein